LEAIRAAVRGDLRPLVYRASPIRHSLLGFKSTAMTLASGTKRWNRSNRFADNKLLRKVAPVILPPGRLRLATSPSLTGSLPRLKTIGIEVVACLAASAATGVSAMITDTRWRTRSAASVGN